MAKCDDCKLANGHAELEKRIEAMDAAMEELFTEMSTGAFKLRTTDEWRAWWAEIKTNETDR